MTTDSYATQPRGRHVVMTKSEWAYEEVRRMILAGELKPGATVTTGELQAWVKDRLRSSRVPATIRFRRSLPYNELGKLLRRVVKQDFAETAGK